MTHHVFRLYLCVMGLLIVFLETMNWTVICQTAVSHGGMPDIKKPGFITYVSMMYIKPDRFMAWCDAKFQETDIYFILEHNVQLKPIACSFKTVAWSQIVVRHEGILNAFVTSDENNTRT